MMQRVFGNAFPRTIIFVLALITSGRVAHSNSDLLSSRPIPFWSQSKAPYFTENHTEKRSRAHYFEPDVQVVSGLAPEQIIKIKINFLDQLAKKIISKMQSDPRLYVRLLSRDMDQVFARVVSLLIDTHNKSDLSYEQRLQILRRIDFAYVSRPLMAVLNTETLKFALKITDHELHEASHVLILDLGFHGNLYTMIERLLPNPDGKFQYALIWRSAMAPSFIQTFDISKAISRVAKKAPYYSTLETQADQKHVSFRVGVIEHGPKWYERITKLTTAYSRGTGAVHLLIDLEDTVMKEVAWENKTTPPLVQIARFTTKDPKLIERYKERLNAKEQTDRTRIHFEMNQDGSISSKLFLHPSFANLLAQIREAVKSGHVKLWIKSTHDPQRTLAIVNGFDWGGFTLADLGAQIVNRAHFKKLKTYSLAQLRQALPIRSNDNLIVFDSEGRKYADLDRHDQVLTPNLLDFALVDAALSDTHSLSQIQKDISPLFKKILSEVKNTVEAKGHPPFAVIISEELLSGHTVVRPGMEHFLKQLSYFAQMDQVQVYISPTRDPNRKFKTFRSSLLNGQSLEQLGFQYVPDSDSTDKSAHAMRDLLNLPTNVMTLYISNQNDKYVQDTQSDQYFQIRSFDHISEQNALAMNADAHALEFQDYVTLRPIIDTLYHSKFQTVDTLKDQKLAVLEIMHRTAQVDRNECEQLLKEPTEISH